jgi:ADP-ribose pyrophosphatase
VADIADEPTSAYPVLDSETVHRTGRVIDLRTDTVAMPDGGSATRDVVVHPGAVGVIALDGGGQVLLIRQYRHAVGRMLWEPPAGLLDVVGEDPLKAAQRELYEEAHLVAGRWDVLVDAFTSPGMTDEAVRIYLARDVAPAPGPRYAGVDEEADLPTEWVPLDEAVQLALSGRLHNPLAVMGVLAASANAREAFAWLRPADSPWREMSPFPGSSNVTRAES